MQSLPWWSLPPIIGAGCALVGAVIAGQPNFPIAASQTALVGGMLGIIVGLGIWYFSRHQSMGLVVDEGLVDAAKRTIPHFPVQLLGLGLAALLLNHLSVVFLDRKFLPLILGGCVFASLGLLGFFVPIVKAERRLHWWEHAISSVILLAGLALSVYLWFVVY